MGKRTFYIAAYDVRDPKRLRQSLRVLKNYATGGQKSVFECFLTDPEKEALVQEMTDVLDLEYDRFLLLRLDSASRSVALGIAVQPADPEFYYVG